jgi:LmbE family N-acetylglucosaminyl deacetylase
MEHAHHIARLLDCELRFLDFRDTLIEYSAAATHQVARTVAEVKPDAVITWGDAWIRGKRHPDHQATGAIVRAAVTVARLKRAVAPIEPHRGTAAIFTLRDRHSVLPRAAIDVSAHEGVVLEVARFYRERVGWPPDEWLREALHQTGRDWGVRAAEEFDAWESAPGLRRSLLGDHLPP